MRELIRDFVKIVSENFVIDEPIYEFGSLQVPGQEGFADLRPFFPGKQYVGCDFREGTGVDKVLDLHAIDIPSESVGTVLCLETLEHVEFPKKAMEEVHRILKPGGITVISSVLNFPIHEFPADYWRFTPEGLNVLLSLFPVLSSYAAGKEIFPHTVVAVGFKSSLDIPRGFEENMNQWKKRWKFENGNTIREYIKVFLPSILLDLGREIKRSARD